MRSLIFSFMTVQVRDPVLGWEQDKYKKLYVTMRVEDAYGRGKLFSVPGTVKVAYG